MHPFNLDFERRRPSRRLLEQNFGLGLTPHEYFNLPPMPPPSHDFYCQWRNAYHQDPGSTIKQDSKKYQINIDVQHFKAEEISVKIVDGFITVEASHDERTDAHGFISRNFKRRYPLPDGVNPDLIDSKLSSDGVLTITAPLNMPNNGDERIVPIVKTGPVKRQEGGEEQ